MPLSIGTTAASEKRCQLPGTAWHSAAQRAPFTPPWRSQRLAQLPTHGHFVRAQLPANNAEAEAVRLRGAMLSQQQLGGRPVRSGIGVRCGCKGSSQGCHQWCKRTANLSREPLRIQPCTKQLSSSSRNSNGCPPEPRPLRRSTPHARCCATLCMLGSPGQRANHSGHVVPRHDLGQAHVSQLGGAVSAAAAGGSAR